MGARTIVPVFVPGIRARDPITGDKTGDTAGRFDLSGQPVSPVSPVPGMDTPYPV
jgi:hypothetical protein